MNGYSGWIQWSERFIAITDINANSRTDMIPFPGCLFWFYQYFPVRLYKGNTLLSCYCNSLMLLWVKKKTFDLHSASGGLHSPQWPLYHGLLKIRDKKIIQPLLWTNLVQLDAVPVLLSWPCAVVIFILYTVHMANTKLLNMISISYISNNYRVYQMHYSNNH